MSMKRDLICPTCDGREIWRIETMKERGPGVDAVAPVGVLLERGFFATHAHGTFETLICKHCGFTEWYAKAIGGLKHDPANGVHLLDNRIESKGGPYR